MNWIVLRLVLFAMVMLAPHQRTHQGELLLLLSMLLFDLVWLAQRRLPDYRTAATLLFSLVAGATSAVFLMGGTMVSIAFVWPSLMLRLEDRPPGESRAALIAAILTMAILAPASDLPLDAIRFIPVVLSLLQFKSGRVASWANTAALAWLLGPLVQACYFPAQLAPAMLARTAVLLTLPQLGLRGLNRD